MSEHTSPELETKLHDLLAAPDADAQFVAGLRSKLIAQVPARTMRRTSPRLAWGIAILLALLVLGLLASSPQVVQAMKWLLGYVPGVGYFERGSTLRVLSESVMVQQQGLTFTLEKGAADPQRTVLLARIDGYPSDHTGAPTCKEAGPRLVTSDGTVVQGISAGSSSDGQPGSVVFVRYEFTAMPANAFDATLEIPCLLFDADYRGWSVPVHFQRAQGSGQVAPVIELPTPLPAPTSASTPAAESAPAGFGIIFKSVATLDDGYVVSGSYRWNDPRIDATMLVVSESNMVDANGQDVPYYEVDSSIAADPSQQQQIPFAYRVDGKQFAWPLKLIVKAITVTQPGEGSFEFDPGPSPKVGQTWDVNLDVQVGAHVVHVEKIELQDGGPQAPNMLGYQFTMRSDPSVASASVEDVHPIIDCQGCGGGGVDAGPSGFSGAAGPFSFGTRAMGYVPAGVKTFRIAGLSVFIKGPWEATWQPAAP